VELLLICAGDEGNASDVNAFYSTIHFVSLTPKQLLRLWQVQPKHTQYRFITRGSRRCSSASSVHSLKGIWYHVRTSWNMCLGPRLEGPPLWYNSCHRRINVGCETAEIQRKKNGSSCDKMIRIAWPIRHTRAMPVRCAGGSQTERLRSAVNKRGSCAAPAVPCLWQRGQGGVWGQSVRARRLRCSEVRHLCGTVKPNEVVLWTRKTCTSCRNPERRHNVVKAARTQPASVLGVCSHKPPADLRTRRASAAMRRGALLYQVSNQ
jgi:hypothetical protein